jgi:hypothetical protein
MNRRGSARLLQSALDLSIYQRQTAHTERLCDSAGGAECAPCNELVCWWERRIDGEDETPGWGAGAAGN